MPAVDLRKEFDALLLAGGAEQPRDLPTTLAPATASGRSLCTSSSCCSHEEGGLREWSVATTRFTGDERGSVHKLHAVRIGPPPDFAPLPGSEFTLDLVLLAMGFLGPFEIPGLDPTMAGVFAAGDLHRGQSLVVWAMTEGGGGAGAIDRYLTGESQPTPV